MLASTIAYLLRNPTLSRRIPYPADEQLSAAVLYKDDPTGEWKGRGKYIEEARRQGAYDGAVFVYTQN
jgi:hypothetical protein